MIRRWGALALLLVASARPAHAQQTQSAAAVRPRASIAIPRVAAAPRLEDFIAPSLPASSPITISGPGPSDGNSAADPERGVRVDGFLQREPGDLVPASETTEAYLSYDASNFYAVFVCRTKDPSGIRARMARRESVFSDDFVGVFLDTFNDHQRAYMFLTTPLGIQADGIVTEGQNDDFSFDTVWHSSGRLTDFGYVVTLTIPFKSLRFQPGPGERTWGISLIRAIPVNNETSFWPGITRTVSSFTSQFADARGFEGVSPGRTIQLIPYATFAGARFLEDAAIDRSADGRAGLDAKVVVHDAVTLDLTANPDFSQVESDEPQVTVNQRFEVFFPEKRPFFLENAGYFKTPLNLFFSRRIRDPQGGARATGKLGGWAVGALAIDDRAPGHALDPGDPLYGDRTFNGVVRARREIGESSVGALVTSRDFGPSSNRVASIDTRLRLNPRWFFDGQAVVSDSKTSTDGSQGGRAYSANLNRGGRKFSYDLSYEDIAPGFQSALGFIPRTDIRQATQFGAVRWRPKTGPVQSFGPNSFVQATWDHRGVMQDWTVRYPFEVSFKHQTGVFVRHVQSMERFQGIEFREHENMVNFFTSYVRWVDFSVNLASGARPNFYPADGLSPFLANFRDLYLSATFRPLSGLLLDETYIYSHLGARPGSGYRGTIFDNHIARSRVNYQFTRSLSLRGILDYNGVLANTSLVGLGRTKHLTADVLMTYLVNPGTALYVGYTDGYDNIALDGAGGVRPIRNPTTPTGRQFFVKSSYLFRF